MSTLNLLMFQICQMPPYYFPGILVLFVLFTLVVSNGPNKTEEPKSKQKLKGSTKCARKGNSKEQLVKTEQHVARKKVRSSPNLCERHKRLSSSKQIFTAKTVEESPTKKTRESPINTTDKSKMVPLTNGNYLELCLRIVTGQETAGIFKQIMHIFRHYPLSKLPLRYPISENAHKMLCESFVLENIRKSERHPAKYLKDGLFVGDTLRLLITKKTIDLSLITKSTKMLMSHLKVHKLNTRNASLPKFDMQKTKQKQTTHDSSCRTNTEEPLALKGKNHSEIHIAKENLEIQFNIPHKKLINSIESSVCIINQISEMQKLVPQKYDFGKPYVEFQTPLTSSNTILNKLESSLSITQSVKRLNIHVAKKHLEILIHIIPRLVKKSWQKVTLIFSDLPKATDKNQMDSISRKTCLSFLEKNVRTRLMHNIKYKYLVYQWQMPTLYMGSLEMLMTQAPLIMFQQARYSDRIKTMVQKSDFINQYAIGKLENNIHMKQIQLQLSLTSVKSLGMGIHKLFTSFNKKNTKYEISVFTSQLTFLSKTVRNILTLHINRRNMQPKWGLPVEVNHVLSVLMLQHPTVDVQPERAGCTYKNTSNTEPQGLLWSNTSHPQALSLGLISHELSVKKLAMIQLWSAFGDTFIKALSTMEKHLAGKCIEISLLNFPYLVQHSLQNGFFVKMPLPQLIHQGYKCITPRKSFFPFVENKVVVSVERNIQYKRCTFLLDAWPLFTETSLYLKSSSFRELSLVALHDWESQMTEKPSFETALTNKLEKHIKQKNLQNQLGLARKIKTLDQLATVPCHTIMPSSLLLASTEMIFSTQKLHFICKDVKDKLHFHLNRIIMLQCLDQRNRILHPLKKSESIESIKLSNVNHKMFEFRGVQSKKKKLKSKEYALPHSRSNFYQITQLSLYFEELEFENMNKLEVHLAKRGIEISMEIIPLVVLKAHHYLHHVQKLSLPTFIIPSSNRCYRKGRFSNLSFLTKKEVSNIDICVRKKHMSFLCGLTAVHTYFSSSIPTASKLFFKSHAREELIPFMEAGAKLDNRAIDLELHISKKKMQCEWSFLSNHVNFPKYFIFPLLGCICTQGKETQYIKVIIQQSDLDFFSEDIVTKLESHLHKIEFERIWRIPANVINSWKLFIPMSPDASEEHNIDASPTIIKYLTLQRKSAECKRMIPSTQRSTGIQSKELHLIDTSVSFILNHIYSPETQILRMHFVRKCLELTFGQTNSVIKMSYRGILSPVKPCLFQLITPYSTIIPMRNKLLLFIPKSFFVDLDFNIRHKQLQFLWGHPTLNVSCGKNCLFWMPTLSPHAPVMTELKVATTNVILKDFLEKLNNHIYKKKLHNKWGIPSLVLQSNHLFSSTAAHLKIPKSSLDQELQTLIVTERTLFNCKDIKVYLGLHLKFMILQKTGYCLSKTNKLLEIFMTIEPNWKDLFLSSVPDTADSKLEDFSVSEIKEMPDQKISICDKSQNCQITLVPFSSSFPNEDSSYNINIPKSTKSPEALTGFSEKLHDRTIKACFSDYDMRENKNMKHNIMGVPASQSTSLPSCLSNGPDRKKENNAWKNIDNFVLRSNVSKYKNRKSYFNVKNSLATSLARKKQEIYQDKLKIMSGLAYFLYHHINKKATERDEDIPPIVRRSRTCSREDHSIFSSGDKATCCVKNLQREEDEVKPENPILTTVCPRKQILSALEFQFIKALLLKHYGRAHPSGETQVPELPLSAQHCSCFNHLYNAQHRLSVRKPKSVYFPALKIICGISINSNSNTTSQEIPIKKELHIRKIPLFLNIAVSKDSFDKDDNDKQDTVKHSSYFNAPETYTKILHEHLQQKILLNAVATHLTFKNCKFSRCRDIENNMDKEKNGFMETGNKEMKLDYSIEDNLHMESNHTFKSSFRLSSYNIDNNKENNCRKKQGKYNDDIAIEDTQTTSSVNNPQGFIKTMSPLVLPLLSSSQKEADESLDNMPSCKDVTMSTTWNSMSAKQNHKGDQGTTEDATRIVIEVGPASQNAAKIQVKEQGEIEFNSNAKVSQREPVAVWLLNDTDEKEKMPNNGLQPQLEGANEDKSVLSASSMKDTDDFTLSSGVSQFTEISNISPTMPSWDSFNSDPYAATQQTKQINNSKASTPWSSPNKISPIPQSTISSGAEQERPSTGKPKSDAKTDPYEAKPETQNSQDKVSSCTFYNTGVMFTHGLTEHSFTYSCSKITTKEKTEDILGQKVTEETQNETTSQSEKHINPQAENIPITNNEICETRISEKGLLEEKSTQKSETKVQDFPREQFLMMDDPVNTPTYTKVNDIVIDSRNVDQGIHLRAKRLQPKLALHYGCRKLKIIFEQKLSAYKNRKRGHERHPIINSTRDKMTMQSVSHINKAKVTSLKSESSSEDNTKEQSLCPKGALETSSSCPKINTNQQNKQNMPRLRLDKNNLILTINGPKIMIEQEVKNILCSRTSQDPPSAATSTSESTTKQQAENRPISDTTAVTQEEVKYNMCNIDQPVHETNSYQEEKIKQAEKKRMSNYEHSETSVSLKRESNLDDGRYVIAKKIEQNLDLQPGYNLWKRTENQGLSICDNKSSWNKNYPMANATKNKTIFMQIIPQKNIVIVDNKNSFKKEKGSVRATESQRQANVRYRQNGRCARTNSVKSLRESASQRSAMSWQQMYSMHANKTTQLNSTGFLIKAY